MSLSNPGLKVCGCSPTMCFQGNIGNADTHYLQSNDTNLWSEFPPQLYNYRITYPEKAKVFFKTCLKFFYRMHFADHKVFTESGKYGFAE